MYPILFSIGPVTIHSFGVMMSLAFLTSGGVAAWQLRKRGLDTEIAYTLLIAAIVGGVVGAKVHYLIVHPEQFRAAIFSGSGLIWYGGLFGGALACWIVAALAKPRAAHIADAVAPALAAGYAVGRVGCLLNGDDYGVPTSLPWAMSFPKGTPPTDALVHPTQIYESLMSLVILGLLVWVLAPRLVRAGSLFWSYVGLAGVERFVVEFVRTNEPVLAGLTQAQVISVIMLVGGAFAVWWLESGKGSGLAAIPVGASTSPSGRGGPAPRPRHATAHPKPAGRKKKTRAKRSR